MVVGSKTAPRELVPYINAKEDLPFLETLPEELAKEFSQLGLRLLDPKRYSRKDLSSTLSAVFGEYLQHVPCLLQSVRSLVRVFHILEVEDDSFDCSYSNPELPFSIFISIPKRKGITTSLRVTEGIIHETMHLQLSLLERLHPLIKQEWSEVKMFSPWKGENRSPQGILHGLYVFSILQNYWEDFANHHSTEEGILFAKQRCEQINSELGQVKDFETHPALTEEGKLIVKNLLRTLEQPQKALKGKNT